MNSSGDTDYNSDRVTLFLGVIHVAQTSQPVLSGLAQVPQRDHREPELLGSGWAHRVMLATFSAWNWGLRGTSRRWGTSELPLGGQRKL